MALRIRSYLPRSLYGRAALILVAPIVIIQLLVSVAFIQRHYEGVTEQMTESLVYELQLVRELHLSGQRDRAQQVADRLGLKMSPAGSQTLDESPAFLDFSGRVIQRILKEGLPDVVGVDVNSRHRAVLLRAGPPGDQIDILIERRRLSASNPHQLLVLMVFAGLLLGIIAYVFLRNQLRPIKKLADASEAFGRGQILPYRPRGAEEVRAAGAAFLQMRARIERQIEQRTLMLSGVSHDLRTPLTRLRLELSMLDPGPEVEAMEADLAEMDRMISGFLDYARGDAAEEAVLTNPLTLLQEITTRARRMGLKVELLPLSVAGAVPEVWLRPDAITRAVENLMNNAARYGDLIEISLSWTTRKLIISIQDDGPGIPPEQHELAMKPFARLDPSRNANDGSNTGLGLAIVAEIAISHGGALQLGKSLRLGGLRADITLAR
ncbi:ATP-binding protein [Falsigemmobacter intermedius]|uniref:histidine kinase n=1 Tax=Falsigemmobacter intermedius TaxID=1553448 RepID=A0A3S3WUX7_9RHOB|nr:ATP-binding protein [Falsigemmobacter intermedius]RWY44594.1 HAMP domain-containing protein [Falsigemmobacter intermedius]